MLETYSHIAVTGGLGFVGRHLADTLHEQGKQVTVITSPTTAVSQPLPPGMRLVRADIREPDQIRQALEGVDLVFHSAANINSTISIERPRFDFETNVCGTFNTLEAALQQGVRRYVYISSAGVYGRPQRFPIDEEHPTRPFVPYGATKLAGEISCVSFFHSHQLPVVIGRPFCIYGPGENPERALVEVSRYLRWHLNHQPIQVVGDRQRKTRDFVYIDDVVQAFLLLADRGVSGEIYNIGSGEEISMDHLIDVISTVSGRAAEVMDINSVTEDTYRLVPDISRLRGLGYTPQVSLDDGIQRVITALGADPALPVGATVFRHGQRAEVS